MGWFDWLVTVLSVGFEQEMSRRTLQFLSWRDADRDEQESSERRTAAEWS